MKIHVNLSCKKIMYEASTEINILKAVQFINKKKLNIL